MHGKLLLSRVDPTELAAGELVAILTTLYYDWHLVDEEVFKAQAKIARGFEELLRPKAVEQEEEEVVDDGVGGNPFEGVMREGPLGPVSAVS